MAIWRGWDVGAFGSTSADSIAGFRSARSCAKWCEVVHSVRLYEKYELYENEERYTEELYDDLGWTEEVKTFLRYNANKALMNLGMDPLFADTANDVNPIVMNGISTGTSNHDFFSQVGNGYLLGTVEAMKDDDYLYGLDK